MSKLDEIILHVEGRLSYAESVGNHKAKEEFLEIRKVLLELKKSKENTDENI